MLLSCPTCRVHIPESAVNLKGGTGHCAACDKTWQLDELARHAETSVTDDERAPSGCVVDRHDGRTIFRVPIRRENNLPNLISFSISWNLFFSIFAGMNLLHTYICMFGAMPSWLPSWIPDIGSSAKGMVLIWIFLTPFIAVGLGSIALIGLFAAGNLRVTVEGRHLSVFNGVGRIGFQRRYRLGEVRGIEIERERSAVNDTPWPSIRIKTASRNIHLGLWLNDDQRRWLAAGLKQTLLKPS